MATMDAYRLIENLPLPIGIARQSDGRVTYLNNKFTQYFGYTLKEISTLSDWCRLACPSLDCGKQPVGRREIAVHCRDGSVRVMQMSTAVEDGEVIMLFNEFAECKQADEWLMEQEVKFRSIFEGSNDAIMLLTKDGFFDCNMRTLEVFGLNAKEEFIACHPADLSPPFQPDGQDSMVAANGRIMTALTQGGDRFEWVHRRKDGMDFHAEVLLSAFDYGQEKVLQATVRDITGRKRAEEALRLANEQLAVQNSLMQEEATLAKKVLEKILYRGALAERCFRFYVSPLALFNGDILLVTHHPAGGYRIMLGDFAGHGLPAAIGAIPVADIFYESTAKGYLIPHLVAEMNAKLRAVLSTEYFLCACLIDVDPADGKVAIWNGGMPDVMLHDGAGTAVRRAGSTHLPLGIVENSQLGLEVHYEPLAQGERIYLFSDGLIEARNQDDEVFGSERLEASLRGSSLDRAFGGVIGALEDFLGDTMYGDDVTLLEIIPELMRVPAGYEKIT